MLNQQDEKTAEDISLDIMIDWIYSDYKDLSSLDYLLQEQGKGNTALIVQQNRKEV